jgi:hypothetical protein
MGYAAEFVRATVVKLQQPFFDHAVLLTYNMHSSTLLIFLDLHFCPQVLKRLQLTLVLLKKELELSKLQVYPLDQIVVINCC